jgi:hypothetical protein
MMTLKYLHFKHFQHNGKMIFNDLLTDRDFFLNDPITCVWYYEHIINSFCKLCKKTGILFGKVQDYFFMTKFQSGGLVQIINKYKVAKICAYEKIR